MVFPVWVNTEADTIYLVFLYCLSLILVIPCDMEVPTGNEAVAFP